MIKSLPNERANARVLEVRVEGAILYKRRVSVNAESRVNKPTVVSTQGLSGLAEE